MQKSFISSNFWNITQSAKQGGGSCVSGFLRTFLQKITFLSDQEVPGCHKNIYRELRPSFTTSEIFGNKCCLFRQQKQHCFKSMWPGTPRGPLGKYVENVIFSLFDLKNHFSAFNGPINIAGGRLDILSTFRMIGTKISRGRSKKSKLNFYFYQKYTKIAILAILVYFW